MTQPHVCDQWIQKQGPKPLKKLRGVAKCSLYKKISLSSTCKLNQDVFSRNQKTQLFMQRHGGLTASELVSRSSGVGLSPSLEHCAVLLGKTLCTLTVPLSTKVKWVPTNSMLRTILQQTIVNSHPRENRNTPSRFMLQKLGQAQA